MNGFRVWCHKRNEWEKGNIVLTQQGKLFDLDKQRNLNMETHNLEFFTGLTLDGIKLFEGDLFKLTFSDGSTVTKVIRYIQNKCQFCVANINDLENEQYWDIWSGITKEWLDKIVNKYEAIGNIHENSELLNA